MTTHATPESTHRKDLLPRDFKPGSGAVHPVIGGPEVMVAVEDITTFVRSRLARAGCLNDLDDALQDIRVAVWSGVAHGHYQSRPGVRFGAWVQGIAKHICATYIAKASAHYSVPLFATEEDDHPGIDRPQDVEPEPSGVAEREWAMTVLKLTRLCAGEEAWGSAMFLLLDNNDGSDGSAAGVISGPDTPAYRRARQDLTFVRQVAITVKNALAVVDSDEGFKSVATVCAAGCLPTELHRAIAAMIIVPRLSGPARLAALPVIAEKVNVTPRYVAVQTGRARSLYSAALRVMRLSHRMGVIPV